MPVTLANEEAQKDPRIAAENARIRDDFGKRQMPLSSVGVYLLAPDKTPIASLHVAVAEQEGVLLKLLQKTVAELHTAPGAPVVKPHPLSRPPQFASDSMAFHLVARGSNQGSWREFPAEVWIVLDHAEWSALLPTGPTALRKSWDVPPTLAAKFLTWFYPQTEDPSSASRSIIQQASFHMTVVTLENGMARAQIDSTLRMEHSFYPGKHSGDGANPDVVNASLTGFMDFDPAERTIQRLRLVTDKATYNSEAFDAALTSVSRETLESQK